MEYPFCVRADVLAKVQQLTIDATSNPSTTEVDDFVKDIASHIKLICKTFGYDPDSLHSVQSTIALTITAGSSKQVVVADSTDMVAGDLIKLEGTTSGAQSFEFCKITAISSNTVTLDTVASNYDANSTITVINNPLRFLRALNATGAAWYTMEAAFQGISPNRSEFAEILKENFHGSETNPVGLWAIQNIPGLLDDSVDAEDQPASRSTIESYCSENEGDADLEPVIEIDESY